MSTITIKRGDTLELECVVQESGQPLNITGWHIESWVRAPAKQVVHKFAAQITAPLAGRYLLPASAAQTELWPVGGMTLDVRYTDAGGVVCDEANPNGSVASIAGICNERRNIVGLMPHPEHNMEELTSPSLDGRAFFASLERFLAAVVG